MIEIPVVRWGEPYESMEKMDVVHFESGETLAQVHEANAGLIKMDIATGVVTSVPSDAPDDYGLQSLLSLS